MNAITSKVLFFILSVFLFLTVVNQLRLATKEQYRTETAVLYTATDMISFQGVFVRNETPVIYDGGGVLSYPNIDGSKIAKGSAVALVYGNEIDVAVNNQIEELKHEIAMLEKSQDPGTTEVAQPEFISELISQRYKLLTNSISKNDIAQISSNGDELLTLLNIMQIVTGREENYNERIDYLNSRLDSLKASQNEYIEAINVDKGGYFISYVDGYENILSIDKIDTMTVTDIENIVNGYGAEHIRNGIGKIFESYKWKMVGVIDNSDGNFLQGNSVHLRLASVPDVINATVEEIKPSDDPTKSIIILNCSYMNTNLVQHRTERVEMSISNYEGIKVPRKAIRFVEGQKGVYTKMGEDVIFKKLDVIYETEDFVISKKTIDTSYVVLYDDIIIEGVDLSDR